MKFVPDHHGQDLVRAEAWGPGPGGRPPGAGGPSGLQRPQGLRSRHAAKPDVQL